MTDIMMKLGDFAFGIESAAYQTLARKNSWRWVEQARISRKPAQQAIGPGAEKLTIAGRIYPHWKGGLGQLPALRTVADQMQPQILVDGTGRVWGKFVITKLVETQKHINEQGQPRRQDFSLEIREYGEDG